MAGIGEYFLVNTIPIPKENSVGTFSIADMKKYVFTVSVGGSDCCWLKAQRGADRVWLSARWEHTLFCLHLNMKRMLSQILMLEWMWRKCSEEKGNVFRVLYALT